MADQEQNSVHRPFHREGEAVVFDALPNPKETAAQTRENEAHEFQREQVKANNRIALFNGLLVFATLCTIGVGIWQSVISQKAANTARDAVDISGKTLQEIVRSNQTQEKLNEKTLQTFIDNFKHEQRAWIEPEVKSLEPYPRPANWRGGDIYILTLNLKNLGKTSARNLRVAEGTLNMSTKEFYSNPSIIKKMSLHQGGIGQEGAPNILSPGDVTMLSDIRMTLQTPYYVSDKNNPVGIITVLIGRIDYDDAFGIHHWHTFCYGFNDLKNLEACKIGNDEDSN